MLLRHATDVVVQRVIHNHLAVGLYGQAPGLRKPGVTHAVLAARGVGKFQVRAPPVGLRCHFHKQARLVGAQARQLGAQVVDPALEVVVEHVTNHGHAALHPLAGATEFVMAELGHAAIAVDHGREHALHRIEAKAVALGDVLNGVDANRGELSHGVTRLNQK